MQYDAIHVHSHVLKPSLPWHNYVHKYSDSSDLASFPGFPASSFNRLRSIKNWTVGRPENVASCDHCGNWHWWYGVVGFVHIPYCCKNSPTPIFSEGKSTSVGDTQWWVKSEMMVVVSHCCTDSPTPIFCETENKQQIRVHTTHTTSYFCETNKTMQQTDRQKTQGKIHTDCSGL